MRPPTLRALAFLFVAAIALGASPADEGPITPERVEALHDAERPPDPRSRLADLHAERADDLRRLLDDAAATRDPERQRALQVRIAAHKLETEIAFFELQLEILAEHPPRRAAADWPSRLEGRVDRLRQRLVRMRSDVPATPTEEVPR